MVRLPSFKRTPEQGLIFSKRVSLVKSVRSKS